MTKGNEKILIVISSDLFVRNYILTDAFSKLESMYECHYVAGEGITNREGLLLKPGFSGFYKIESAVKTKHQKIFDTLMWTYRERSSSFRFRIRRQMPDFKRVVSGPPRRLHLRFLKWTFLKPYMIMKGLLLDIKFINRLYLKWLTRSIHPNSELNSYIDKEVYDLVIFPSAAYDVDGIDVAWITEVKQMSSLFLIDNWDNISSKSILWKKPKFLAVWGEQSKNHAIKIQEFDKNKITLLGTPRFDNYFRTRDLVLQSHFDFKYILFVGTALNFDEESLLDQIDVVIENNKAIWGNVKIVYRPHPWRQNNCQVRNSYGKHVVTDPQILQAKNNKTIETQPRLEYYSGLLQNAEFVMGGLTSMLIESLIFRKQFLAFVHDDDKHISNMRNAWDYFEHFQGLENVAAMSFSLDESDIEKSMLDCWSKRDFIEEKTCDEERMAYLFDDGERYANRLLSLVSNILD